MYIVSNDQRVSYEVATTWKQMDRGLIYWGIIMASDAGLTKRAKDINQDTECRKIMFRVPNKSNFVSDQKIQFDCAKVTFLRYEIISERATPHSVHRLVQSHVISGQHVNIECQVTSVPPVYRVRKIMGVGSPRISEARIVNSCLFENIGS